MLFLYQAIKKHIRPQLQFLKKDSSTATARSSLTLAVAISILVSKYHLNVDKDELMALLKSLLIHPDTESQRCLDYEDLVKVIGDTR